jgi:LacI family transcriptional regulator
MQEGKEVTIYDIARELNLSAATVSRGLKDHPAIRKKTKKKIVDLANEMGYRTNHFARNLRARKTNTIGVIVPRLNSYFMSAVIAGIESVANSKGYNLIISQSSEDLEKEVANAFTMFNSRVDGLLVSLVHNTDSLKHFDAFLKKKVPVIFFDRVSEQKSCPTILIDNKKAAYEATAHLINNGCKNIVHITAPPKTNVYRDRLLGYKQALEESNIPFKPDNVILSNFLIESGVNAAEQIKRMNPLPDGVFVANDNSAVGCMVALKKAGIRIPEDIAFVGFNNDPVSTVVEPNLTTIHYPGYEMGEIAASNLIDQVKGEGRLNSTDTIILRSELIVRASSLHR